MFALEFSAQRADEQIDRIRAQRPAADERFTATMFEDATGLDHLHDPDDNDWLPPKLDEPRMRIVHPFRRVRRKRKSRTGFATVSGT